MRKVNCERLLCGLFFLVASLSLSEAIHCYECSSSSDSLCKMPFRAFNSSVDCSTNPIPERLLKRPRVEMCRKTWQRSEVRITRTCGFVSHEEFNDQCVLQKMKHARQMSCACSTDLCNTGHFSNPRLGHILMVLCLLTSALQKV